MNPLGLLVRALFCFLAIFAVWNPIGVSYLAWVVDALADDRSVRVPELTAAGVVLFAVNLFLARTAYLSLGVAGVAFIALVLLVGGLALHEAGVVTFWREDVVAYVPLLALWVVLTIGLVWSIFKRRVAGQSNGLDPPP